MKSGSLRQYFPECYEWRAAVIQRNSYCCSGTSREPSRDVALSQSNASRPQKIVKTRLHPSSAPGSTAGGREFLNTGDLKYRRSTIPPVYITAGLHYRRTTLQPVHITAE